MFRESINKVKVEGILAESNLEYKSFQKNGQDTEAIAGNIKVLVEQVINGEEVKLEVPIHSFVTKYTSKGTVNPAFESLEKVMKEYVSIAACGDKEVADKVRITNARIKMNEFKNQNGSLVSQPRITASFISRAVGDFNPCATFNLDFMVSSMRRETDADGVEVEPAKLLIDAVVSQYTPADAAVMNVDLVPLTVVTPNIISAVEEYWEVGQCFKASGRLNFSSKTVTEIEEVDFGEPQTVTRTVNVNELIITGGSQVPLEGEFAFDINDVKAGLAARKERIENNQTKVTNKAPTQKPTNLAQDLGF